MAEIEAEGEDDDREDSEVGAGSGGVWESDGAGCEGEMGETRGMSGGTEKGSERAALKGK